ncbi:MAG: 50S ribosomal protein L15e [Candidatus Aenigmarchaeota archaeon]|nr:50S ribosomal protein L15e [Candidatus Aenigmarchaeota archaeon]
MNLYQSIRNAWKKPKELKNYKNNLIKWRKEPAIKRVEKPTRIDRARSLGYKAKQGFIVVRARIKKGGRKRQKPSGGRKPKKSGLSHFTPKKGLQRMTEERVARRFPNMEVLNSYQVGDDGVSKWFEVILVDPNHPVIKRDKNINWILNQKRRVFRGMTSAGKKTRNL